MPVHILKEVPEGTPVIYLVGVGVDNNWLKLLCDVLGWLLELLILFGV
jgi:hypothetical protein